MNKSTIYAHCSYVSPKHLQLCSRFNSTLSAIRERDIPILTHYSRVEFDGLPHSLIPTLSYLQNGQWPQSWNVLAVLKNFTLIEGMEGLKLRLYLDWIITFYVIFRTHLARLK